MSPWSYNFYLKKKIFLIYIGINLSSKSRGVLYDHKYLFISFTLLTFVANFLFIDKYTEIIWLWMLVLKEYKQFKRAFKKFKKSFFLIGVIFRLPAFLTKPYNMLVLIIWRCDLLIIIIQINNAVNRFLKYLENIVDSFPTIFWNEKFQFENLFLKEKI